MVISRYPQRAARSRYAETLIIYGAAGILGFAITFAIAWFAPSVGLILLLAPIVHFLLGKDYSKGRALRLFLELLLTYAAVLSAAALK